jgi:hypothetical protein
MLNANLFCFASPVRQHGGWEILIIIMLVMTEYIVVILAVFLFSCLVVSGRLSVYWFVIFPPLLMVL